MQFCSEVGCGALVLFGRCKQHAVQLEHMRRNRDIRKWYYTSRWIHLRQQVMTEAWYTCAACGQVQADLQVDHIVKHEGDPARFWDRANLQPLCPRCHNLKTRRGE
jgi:5-methylcytosine-specific restriction endonuclease McrA